MLWSCEAPSLFTISTQRCCIKQWCRNSFFTFSQKSFYFLYFFLLSIEHCPFLIESWEIDINTFKLFFSFFPDCYKMDIGMWKYEIMFTFPWQANCHYLLVQTQQFLVHVIDLRIFFTNLSCFDKAFEDSTSWSIWPRFDNPLFTVSRINSGMLTDRQLCLKILAKIDSDINMD